MSTALPKWESLHTIAANAFAVSVDGAANIFLPAGDYYWESVADGGSVSLRSALQTLLAAVVASTTVTINDTTGRILITWGSGIHSLDLQNTATRTRMGAAATSMGLGSGLLSTYQVKGLWLPNVPGFNNGSVNGPGLPESDRKVTISQSGAVYATSNSERRPARWQFKGLTKAKMLTADETLVNESLETLWRDGLNHSAGIFRHYPDRSVDGTYTTWQSTMTTGLRPTRLKGAYDAVWDSGEMAAMSYVHVATGGGF